MNSDLRYLYELKFYYGGRFVPIDLNNWKIISNKQPIKAWAYEDLSDDYFEIYILFSNSTFGGFIAWSELKYNSNHITHTGIIYLKDRV